MNIVPKILQNIHFSTFTLGLGDKLTVAEVDGRTNIHDFNYGQGKLDRETLSRL